MASILRVRAPISLSNGTPGLMTIYWRPGTGGGSTADATDCLARVRAFVAASSGAIHAGTTYTFNPACDIFEDSTGTLTGSFTGTTPAGVAGGGTGDPLPAMTAWLVKWSTGSVVNGRRLQGRTYLSVPNENNNDTSGRPNAATIITIANAGIAMLTGGATASFPVVWNRPRAADPDHGITARAGTSAAVTNCSVDGLKWGVQRNRRF